MNGSSYEMHKKPIKITQEMKKGAQESQEKNNDERAGTQERQDQSRRLPKWKEKRNEKNLRDDHSQELQEENDERAGTQEGQEQSRHLTELQEKRNEKNLRDDHGAYEDKNVK